MKMGVGCTLLVKEDLEAALAAGCDYVEFMGKYLTALDRESYLSLQRRMDSLKLTVYGINGYCPPEVKMAGPGFDADAAQKYAARCAFRAAGLGARVAGIGSPMSRNLPSGYDRRAAQRQMSDFLKITAEEFGKYDMAVCLEPLAPCYCNFINRLEEAAELVEACGIENLALVVDFYNMEYVNEADTELTKYMPLIRHAHISDDDGDCSKRACLKPEKKRTHQRRIAALYREGYQGNISVETDSRIDAERMKATVAVIRSAV